jgi:hypothetical protein
LEEPLGAPLGNTPGNPLGGPWGALRKPLGGGLRKPLVEPLGDPCRNLWGGTAAPPLDIFERNKALCADAQASRHASHFP